MLTVIIHKRGTTPSKFVFDGRELLAAEVREVYVSLWNIFTKPAEIPVLFLQNVHMAYFPVDMGVYPLSTNGPEYDTMLWQKQAEKKGYHISAGWQGYFGR